MPHPWQTLALSRAERLTARKLPDFSRVLYLIGQTHFPDPDVRVEPTPRGVVAVFSWTVDKRTLEFSEVAYPTADDPEAPMGFRGVEFLAADPDGYDRGPVGLALRAQVSALVRWLLFGEVGPAAFGALDSPEGLVYPAGTGGQG